MKTTIGVTFLGLTWVKKHPLSFDKTTQVLFSFDVSGIPEDLQPNQLVSDIKAWEITHRQRICEWLTSGICPSPQAFEAYDSAWVAEAKALLDLLGAKTKPLHHYLFYVNSWFVEILAEGFEWVEIFDER